MCESDHPYAKARWVPVPVEQAGLWGIDLLNVPRSDRIQTVHAETNPQYDRLLRAFESHAGCRVLINTSFNVRGEPIVCTPEDAHRCFMRMEMDVLVLENCVLYKTQQKPLTHDTSWQKEFELD